MIFHDRVNVVMGVSFEPPQYDAYGIEIFDHVEQTVSAEVFPLDTDAVLRQGDTFVISRYRMLLAPQVDISPQIGDRLRLEWDVFTINPGQPSGLYVDGTVERHAARSAAPLRTHHQERDVMA